MIERLTYIKWNCGQIRCGIILLHDVAVAFLSIYIALLLRQGDISGGGTLFGWPHSVAVLCAFLFGLSCYLAHMHRRFWRYSSTGDSLTVMKLMVVTLAALYIPLVVAGWPDDVPRSLPLLQFVIMSFGLNLPRLGYCAIREAKLNSGSIKAVLVGESEAASTFLQALAKQRDLDLEVRAVFTTEEDKIGRWLHGLPIRGVRHLLSSIDNHSHHLLDANMVVLTGSLPYGDAVELMNFVQMRGLELRRTLPPLELLTAPDHAALSLHPVLPNDLLARTEIRIDPFAVQGLLHNRKICVTGAAGSIGSELARQVASRQPSKLYLIDHNECGLFYIERELRERYPSLDCRVILCDVRLRRPLITLFCDHSPDLVFHAAALKHVPMVEKNPCDGVFNNAIGTQNVADACLEAGVAAMVQISTDKAVNPANVMGASKRLAEFYCQAADLKCGDEKASTGQEQPHFLTVRFGNVLGSSGSVIPVFQQQIARGGPVTVTDPRMARYLMTTQEAVSLVLQATADGVASEERRGTIFVLDMGQPVQILELAERMIRLAGLKPYYDIEIAFTGMRPGEKLSEELFDVNEKPLQSATKSVLWAASNCPDLKQLRGQFDRLARSCLAYDEAAVRAQLAELVPGFSSQHG
jgi:O-antigen biosynthesis protein WbqV